MKISKEDFKKKITEIGLDDDKQIELLEDVEDSWTDGNTEEVEALRKENEEIKRKYKERFLGKTESEDEDEEEKIKEELDDKIIDIKEI